MDFKHSSVIVWKRCLMLSWGQQIWGYFVTRFCLCIWALFNAHLKAADRWRFSLYRIAVYCLPWSSTDVTIFQHCLVIVWNRCLIFTRGERKFGLFSPHLMLTWRHHRLMLTWRQQRCDGFPTPLCHCIEALSLSLTSRGSCSWFPYARSRVSLLPKGTPVFRYR